MMRLNAQAWPSAATFPYVRLDMPAEPEGWPLVFQSIDPQADEGVRLIELHTDRVVLRRRIEGVARRLELELRAYQGVGVALLDPEGDGEGVAVVLLHADPALSVTLYSAPDIDDVVAQWRMWSARFGLPMLVTAADGSRTPAYPMIGRLTVDKVRPRRLRRGALKDRRPTVFRRRMPGRTPVTAAPRG